MNRVCRVVTFAAVGAALFAAGAGSAVARSADSHQCGRTVLRAQAVEIMRYCGTARAVVALAGKTYRITGGSCFDSASAWYLFIGRQTRQLREGAFYPIVNPKTSFMHTFGSERKPGTYRWRNQVTIEIPGVGIVGLDHRTARLRLTKLSQGKFRPVPRAGTFTAMGRIQPIDLKGYGNVDPATGLDSPVAPQPPVKVSGSFTC